MLALNILLGAQYIPRTTALRVIRRDNGLCQECGKPVLDRSIAIDHSRIPFSKGGPTEEHNLQVLCSDCNGKKGARVPLYLLCEREEKG
jgi:5-methylcytosine-specific restriction endonuclease McrA